MDTVTHYGPPLSQRIRALPMRVCDVLICCKTGNDDNLTVVALRAEQPCMFCSCDFLSLFIYFFFFNVPFSQVDRRSVKNGKRLEVGVILECLLTWTHIPIPLEYGSKKRTFSLVFATLRPQAAVLDFWNPPPHLQNE